MPPRTTSTPVERYRAERKLTTAIVLSTMIVSVLVVLSATQDNIRAIWEPRNGYPSYVCDSYTPLVEVVVAVTVTVVMCPLIFFLYRGTRAVASRDAVRWVKLASLSLLSVFTTAALSLVMYSTAIPLIGWAAHVHTC